MDHKEVFRRQQDTARLLRSFRAVGFDFAQLVELFQELIESVGGTRTRWMKCARLWRLILLQARRYPSPLLVRR